MDNVMGCVERALNKLVQNDIYLLENDIHERTITHCLAIYLGEQFPGWNVDCEYNNDLGPGKRIRVITEDLSRLFDDEDIYAYENYECRAVYPDIIVHQRGTDQNLLVIEVKKNNQAGAFDKVKLSRYKQELQYQHALFLRISTGRPISVKSEWYHIDPVLS